jgi:hypothetical protein
VSRVKRQRGKNARFFKALPANKANVGLEISFREDAKSFE